MSVTVSCLVSKGKLWEMATTGSRGMRLTGTKSEGCEDPTSHEHNEVEVHLEHRPDLGLTKMKCNEQ